MRKSRRPMGARRHRHDVRRRPTRERTGFAAAPAGRHGARLERPRAGRDLQRNQRAGSWRGQTPPVGSLHMAMTQLAVYDAVNSIHGGFEPYLAGLPPAAPGSLWTPLSRPLPTMCSSGSASIPCRPCLGRQGPAGQALRRRARTIPDGAEKAGGIAAGAAAAAAMLVEANRRRPLRAVLVYGGHGSGRVAKERARCSDPFAWVAKVEAVHARKHRPVPDEWSVRPREHAVRERLQGGKGARLGDEHVNRRTDGARDVLHRDPGGDVPARIPGHHRGRRDRTRQRGTLLCPGERVRRGRLDQLLDDKEYWHFWRPITAIQNGDADDNRQTSGDPVGRRSSPLRRIRTIRPATTASPGRPWRRRERSSATRTT